MNDKAGQSKKPKILISACLLGENCKYDGGNNLGALTPEILQNLAQIYDFIAVCPEQLGGLSTPRESAEICPGGRVRTKFTRTDVTDKFVKGAKICADIARQNGCLVAILKQRSPSCGSGEIYDGSFTRRLVLGDGFAVRELKNIGVQVLDESEACEILSEDKFKK